MKTIGGAILGLVLALTASVTPPVGAQDLSTFLSQPPAPGAWARYRIETKKSWGIQREPFNLAIIDRQVLDGQPYVWLEAGPTNFAGYKDGYLRLLLKAHPDRQEALNPFLEALALAYQPPGGDPFKLSGGALSFMHSQAKDVQVHQETTDLPPEPAQTVKGVVYQCSRMTISTTTQTTFLTRKYKVTEAGTYWVSPDTPFRIVRAEIVRTEYKNGKENKTEVTVQLKDSGESGATSHFTAPIRKEKGLLGLLFH